MVMNTLASVAFTPKASMPRETPVEKIVNGVAATPAFNAPVPAVFRSEYMMAATMMARMPTKDSVTMAP